MHTPRTALLSQHSSVCSELSSTSEPAPQVTGGQELPMITVSQSRVATQLLRGSAGLRNSVDSGLECANSADDINALQVYCYKYNFIFIITIIIVIIT